MKMYNCQYLHRLNNNENPLGPPMAAQRVLADFPPPRAAIYPSGDAFHLRCRLGDKFGLHPDQILVGNGSNEVISFVIKAFCQEGDNIVTADKTFAVYEWIAQFSGFEPRLVPLKNFEFDDMGMLKAIDNKTKIVFLCNPNNPTGQYWSEKKLRNFLDKLNGRQILVMDEAYFEFVDKKDFPNGIKLIDEYPNLVVFRTFSKMYALAGLRIGYLAGSLEIVELIRRTCVVYSVNTLAQIAAFECINDQEHIFKTREMVDTGKEFLIKELKTMGLKTIFGQGNFIMVKLPINDSLAYRKLMSQGIMVRSMTGFRAPDWIRITMHHKNILEKFLEALLKILKD
jgi:histidinol-phosphate aminotransferase